MTDIRRALIMAIQTSGIEGIELSTATVESDASTMTFECVGRPWAFIITADTDLGITGSPSYYLTRATGIYSLYGSGGYRGGINAGTNDTPRYDFWTVASANISYDEATNVFTFKTASTKFRAGVEHKMFYITEPRG